MKSNKFLERRCAVGAEFRRIHFAHSTDFSHRSICGSDDAHGAPCPRAEYGQHLRYRSGFYRRGDPGAVVTATDPAHAITRAVKSNGSGEFTISGLPIGTYTLTATSPQFENSVITGIRVDANADIKEIVKTGDRVDGPISDRRRQ